jgi:uncharacterized membrane protein
MDQNWIIITVVILLGIALVIYLFIRNQKDKDELITFLNEKDVVEERNTKNQE